MQIRTINSLMKFTVHSLVPKIAIDAAARNHVLCEQKIETHRRMGPSAPSIDLVRDTGPKLQEKCPNLPVASKQRLVLGCRNFTLVTEPQ